MSGEYGIGKSSLASYVKLLAEKKYNLFGIHVLLGGAENETDLAAKTVRTVLESQAYLPSKTEKLRNIFASLTSLMPICSDTSSVVSMLEIHWKLYRAGLFPLRLVNFLNEMSARHLLETDGFR